MPDCPPLVLPQVPEPSLWPPLVIAILVSVGVLLAIGCGLAMLMTLRREGRRHAAWMRVHEEMFAEQYPDLYAARQARDVELEARIALVLAQLPPWWQRFTRRTSP